MAQSWLEPMTNSKKITQPNTQEFYTEERCYITELLNNDAYPDHSLARARVASGITTQWHRVKVEELYIIEKGTGRADIGEVTYDVKAGDTVIIPPMVPQRITNTGDDDLVFLCLCTSRFTNEGYESLE